MPRRRSSKRAESEALACLDAAAESLPRLKRYADPVKEGPEAFRSLLERVQLEADGGAVVTLALDEKTLRALNHLADQHGSQEAAVRWAVLYATDVR